MPQTISPTGTAPGAGLAALALADGSLFSHSAVPLTGGQKAALDALGPLQHIVAPSAMHHLFVGKLARLYPQARIYGTQGVLRKRPDLPLLEPLPPDSEAPWAGELQCLRLDGIPMLDETLWFHPASGSLIATDVLQYVASIFARGDAKSE